MRKMLLALSVFTLLFIGGCGKTAGDSGGGNNNEFYTPPEEKYISANIHGTYYEPRKTVDFYTPVTLGTIKKSYAEANLRKVAVTSRNITIDGTTYRAYSTDTAILNHTDNEQICTYDIISIPELWTYYYQQSEGSASQYSASLNIKAAQIHLPIDFTVSGITTRFWLEPEIWAPE
jgi:hypothetical protein